MIRRAFAAVMAHVTCNRSVPASFQRTGKHDIILDNHIRLIPHLLPLGHGGLLCQSFPAARWLSGSTYRLLRRFFYRIKLPKRFQRSSIRNSSHNEQVMGKATASACLYWHMQRFGKSGHIRLWFPAPAGAATFGIVTLSVEAARRVGTDVPLFSVCLIQLHGKQFVAGERFVNTPANPAFVNSSVSHSRAVIASTGTSVCIRDVGGTQQLTTQRSGYIRQQYPQLLNRNRYGCAPTIPRITAAVGKPRSRASP